MILEAVWYSSAYLQCSSLPSAAAAVSFSLGIYIFFNGEIRGIVAALLLHPGLL